MSLLKITGKLLGTAVALDGFCRLRGPGPARSWECGVWQPQFLMRIKDISALVSHARARPSQVPSTGPELSVTCVGLSTVLQSGPLNDGNLQTPSDSSLPFGSQSPC